MKLKKSVIALVLVTALMATLLLGCNKTQTEATTTPAATTTAAQTTVAAPASDPDVEIVWWQYPRWTNLAEGKSVGDMENEIAADFTKENPNAKVKIEQIAWNDGPEKVNVAIAANNMPDLLFDFPGRIMAYAAQDVLLAMNDIFTDELRKDIPAALLPSMEYKGNVVMYPVGAVPIAAAVNTDIFKKIGAMDLLPLDREDRTWTLAEFEKALKAVKEKAPDVYPSFLYAMNEQGDSSMRMFLQSSFDTELINAEKTQIIINSENGINGFKWMKQAYKDGLFAPGAESANSLNSIETFFQGKSAINLISAPSHIGLYKTYLKDGKAVEMNWVLIPYPNAEGAKPKVEVQTSGFCLFNNEDEMKAKYSKKFLDFTLNGKYKEEAVRATGQLPARISLAGKLYDDPEYAFAEKLLKYASDTAYTAPNYAELRTKWYPMFQGVLTDLVTPEDGLNTFAREATEIINKK